MKKSNSKHVVLIAFGANLLIALAKFTVFIFTHSSSMFSEAIHSFADTGNQLLLLFGMKRAKKKPDSLHQFGYGQEQFFWAFMVAILLFTLGGLYSIGEGLERIIHKHPIENVYLAVFLLIFSILMESISFSKAYKELKKLKGETGFFAFLKKSFSVELLVVFFEDLAAITGLSIALFCIFLSYLTSNSVFDGIGSVLIGILLCVIAFILGSEMKSLIIGEAIPDEMAKYVEKVFSNNKGVKGISDFKSMVLGEKSMLVALELVVEENLKADEIRKIIDKSEKEIRERFPEIKNIYVEVRTYRRNYA